MTTSKRISFVKTASVVLMLLTFSTLAAIADEVPAGFTRHFADMAVDIHDLVTSLEFKRASVVGHDIGLMYFKNFERDAKDFAEMSKTPLPMPVLALTGEKASGTFLIEQTKLAARNVDGKVIAGSGHWLIDEAPQQTIPALVTFIDGGK